MVCLVVLAAVVAPSLVILQVRQKSLRVVLKMLTQVVVVPLDFPELQELESNPFPVTQR